MAQDQLLLSDGASNLLLSDGVSVLLLSTSSGPVTAPELAVRRFYNLTSEADYPLSSRTSPVLSSRLSYRS